MPPPADPRYEQQPYKKRSNNTWIWILLGALGICGCGGGVVLIAVLYPVFLQARMAAQRTSCVTNLSRLSLAGQAYAADHDGTLPYAAGWMDGLDLYVSRERSFHCPVLRGSGGYGYAMNGSLSRQRPAKTDTSLVLFFETPETGRNAIGDPANTPFPNRHGNGRTVVTASGGARWIRNLR